MGLLDSMVGALGQSQGGAGQGGQAQLLQMVMGMLAGSGGNAGAAGGGGLAGLASLAAKFQQGGLGDVMSSWVGNGQNQPIAPEQLGGLLGQDTVASMASQMGVNSQDLLGQLSQLLPQVVDKLTPEGQLPSAQAGSAGLGDLAGMLGGLFKR